MPNAPHLPAFLYGLHDIGGHQSMLEAQRPGWVLDSIDLRAQAAADYTSLADAGLGVVVRLNHGYGNAGTIPPSDRYHSFAATCAAFVENSPGVLVWVIGNEMNISAERPQLADLTSEVITPEMYARCFTLVRRAIKALPGHEADWIIPGAVGPYNAETGDWVQYLTDLLRLLGPEGLDGIALHCFTHDYSVEQLTDDSVMAPPFEKRHFNFRAYRDFLSALEASFRTLPVFITEAGPIAGWRDRNIGWIQSAYREIDEWNGDPDHQPIQALIISRWRNSPDNPNSGIEDKPSPIADFRASLERGYRLRIPTIVPAPLPALRAQWTEPCLIPNNEMIAGSVLRARLIVRNTGTTGWRAASENPVRLGYRWYNEDGQEIPVDMTMTLVPDDVPPGGIATFGRVELRAPQAPGHYMLRWDLYREDVGWFSAGKSPVLDLEVMVSRTREPTPLPMPAFRFEAREKPAAPVERPPFRFEEREMHPEPVEMPPFRFEAREVQAEPAEMPVLRFEEQEMQVEAVELPPHLPEPVAVDGSLAVVFTSHDSPVSLASGQVASVSLQVRNEGKRVWESEGTHPVHVGYKWFDETGQRQIEAEGRRTALPIDVAPGEEVSLGVMLLAPRRPGNYRLHWDMVSEGVTWFGDAGGTPLVVPVSVTALARDVTGWRVESPLNPQQVASSLDGDPLTFWDSLRVQEAGHWFRLNLSAPRVLDGVQFLSPGKGFPAGYVLRISSNGMLWNEIARVEAGNQYDVMAVFAPQPVQYAQIDLLTTPSTPSSWMISEILVHSAATWAASASHNPAAAGLAIDNRQETAWSSQIPQVPGMWFQIDLGRVETVSGLGLTPRPAEGGVFENPVSFRVATWNARTGRWQIACERSKNYTPVDVIFSATQTQFINIQLLQAAPHPWSIGQARVIREMDTWLGPST